MDGRSFWTVVLAFPFLRAPPVGSEPAFPGRRARTWALVALAGLLIAAEWSSFRSAGSPARFLDTNCYEEVSEAPLHSFDFLAGERPITLALLFKATGRDATVIARIQSLLSVFSWFTLAWAVSNELTTRAARTLAAAVVCAFSLVAAVNRWDWVLLSESLSLSLLALCAGLSMFLTRAVDAGSRWTIPLVSAWLCACLLFGATRDTNLSLLACMWAALVPWSLQRSVHKGKSNDPGTGQPWKARVACLAGLTIVIVALHTLILHSGRWQLPLVNVLLTRVIPNPRVYRDLSTEHGLPRNSEFERYVWREGWSRLPGEKPLMHRLWEGDPALADVEGWLRERGASAYSRFLLFDHPVRSIRAAVAAYSVYVSQPIPPRYGSEGETGWTRALSRCLYPTVRAPVLLAVLVFAASVGLALLSASARRLAVIAALCIAGSGLVGFVAFHGDTSNVDRHMASSGVLLHLGVVLLAAVLFDRVLGAVPRILHAGNERPLHAR